MFRTHRKHSAGPAIAVAALAWIALGAAEPARAASPLFVLRIHAVKLADDDGGRAAEITPGQVKLWVDKANQMFADSAAGIYLQFDADPSGPDWTSLKNTTLNNLASSGGGWSEANALAAKYPGKIVIFFRHGPGSGPTGNGFAFPPQSGLVTNFVALPGFNQTSVRTGKDAKGDWIWTQNIWQLAHDVGHYLGLYHTFPGWSDDATDSPAKAAAYIAARGGSRNALDGDGLEDTPPEAGTAFYLNQGWDPCAGPDRYTISGSTRIALRFGSAILVPFSHTFIPDRRNVMSYFACEPMGFTPQQVARMRETLELPSRRLLLTPPCPPDFHGLPAERFQLCFDYWVSRGLWPVTLSASLSNGKILMSGSFQRGGNRPVRHLITADQYEADFLKFRDQGFRPGHVNILNTADGLRFTAVWTPIDGPFESFWGMTAGQYEARWQKLREQGYLQADLFVYREGGLRFAATWVKKPFADYASYWGMTADQYHARSSELGAKGLRVTHFIAYRNGAARRYAAIWEKRAGEWVHHYGMDFIGYQKRYESMASQGFRLYQIHAYEDRYSAVWYKPWQPPVHLF